VRSVASAMPTSRLIRLTPSAEAPTKLRASALARSIRPSAGTTSSTRPRRSASSTATSRAESISSLARCTPTTRGSVYIAAKSGTRPTRMNDRQKRAVGVATTKSAISARLKPAPKAGPSTAAISGLSSSTSCRIQGCTSRMRSRQVSTVAVPLARASAMPRMSPPAQNAPPAPVRITARIDLSAAIAGTTRANSSFISALSALRASGRFIVSVATPSVSSKVRLDMVGSFVRR